MRNATSRQANRGERGDTIIEVILAIAVLAVLITITYTVMTRSLAITYNALDRTNSQAVVNGQVNMLRAAHARYISPSATVTDKQAWLDIVTHVKNIETPLPETAADKDNRNNGCELGVNYTHAFFFAPSDGSLNVLTNATQKVRKPSAGATPTPGDGLWIEGYEMTRSSDGSIVDNVYTFYVKACTDPIFGDGSTAQRQTKTAVRLYAQ